MLRISNLHAGYNGNKILRGIDLNVRSNEIVAIFGHNGSGKSTLLKSIFNLSEIYSGKILFEGKDLTRLNTSNLIKFGISYAPQGRQIFRKLTVKENLELSMCNANNLKYSYELFPFLKEKKNDVAQTLSGGQQQLLGICRVLAQNPKLMLLDEPSLGLDPKSIKLVFEKIKEINNNGITIVIAEQNINSTIKIADRYYFLNNGKITFKGKKSIPSTIWEDVGKY